MIASHPWSVIEITYSVYILIIVNDRMVSAISCKLHRFVLIGRMILWNDQIRSIKTVLKITFNVFTCLIWHSPPAELDQLTDRTGALHDHFTCSALVNYPQDPLLDSLESVIIELIRQRLSPSPSVVCTLDKTRTYDHYKTVLFGNDHCRSPIYTCA